MERSAGDTTAATQTLAAALRRRGGRLAPTPTLQRQRGSLEGPPVEVAETPQACASPAALDRFSGFCLIVAAILSLAAALAALPGHQHQLLQVTTAFFACSTRGAAAVLGITFLLTLLLVWRICRGLVAVAFTESAEADGEDARSGISSVYDGQTPPYRPLPNLVRGNSHHELILR